MRAAVNQTYGSPDVVRAVEVPTPKPGPRDVLVRVHAAPVTSADARMRAAQFPRGFTVLARIALGIRRPRRTVLGNAFSGVIESVGTEVDAFAVGDAVCGMTGARMGAHAEYAVAPAVKTTPLPTGVSHDDAAAILFGGTTALHFLRDKASLETGQSVLVNGAAGAIGTAAIQLAIHYGAVVTGVTSTRNLDLVSDLGAHRVIDYTATPVTELADLYDVVLDAVGNLDIESGRGLLTDGGVLLLAVADLPETLRARGNVKAGPAPEKAADFAELVGLLATGELTSVIDKVAGLDEVAALHTRVDSGRKVGNVILQP